jgi:superfamily II DNA/RNA helicase
VLAAFRTGDIRTLVATDIAARGIDVDGISHVINFDLTNIPETYVHRIGRTARAGADGTAISLVAGAEELGYLRDIERLIKVTLPKEDRRTPGQQQQRPAGATQQRQGRSSHGHGHNPNNHGARANDGAPGSKGPAAAGVRAVVTAWSRPTVMRVADVTKMSVMSSHALLTAMAAMVFRASHFFTGKAGLRRRKTISVISARSVRSFC